MRLCVESAKIFQVCSRAAYFSAIVGEDGAMVSQGWNGAPSGMRNCVDGGCPRADDATGRRGVGYDNCVAIHAEANAILHASPAQRKGATLYVNGPPCFSCSKLIANSGLAKVVCLEDKRYTDFDRCVSFMRKAGVAVVVEPVTALGGEE